MSHFVNPRPLSHDLLEEIRQQWITDRAPTARWLSPGLSDADMDTATAPLGFRLSPEARALWSWRDGVGPSQVPPDEAAAQCDEGDTRWIGSGWQPLSLAQAVALTIECRGLIFSAYDDDEDEARLHWPDGTLVLTRPDRPTLLTINCLTEVPVNPVFRFYMDDAGLPTLHAPSIGELAERWLAVMRAGIANYVHERGRWNWDGDRVDDAHPV